MLIAQFRMIQNVKDFQENYLDDCLKKGITIDGACLFCVDDYEDIIDCLNKYRTDKIVNCHKESVDFVVLIINVHELVIEQTSLKTLSYRDTTVFFKK